MSNKRKLALAVGLFGLVCIYIFQREFFYEGFTGAGAASAKVDNFRPIVFALSKLIRFLLNDSLALLIIFALFVEKKYRKFAFGLFLVELLILLPVYLISVIWFYEDTRFYVQHLHRLVVNPFFMMLLIPAFYYQKSL